MPCLLQQTYANSSAVTGRARRKNIAFSLIKNINSCWTKITKQATGASKKVKQIALDSPRKSIRPKQLFVTLGNNFKVKNNKRTLTNNNHDDDLDFGDGGLWQRDILMGDKCQPLDFSGVIYYDNSGKRLSELPAKSPRAGPPLNPYF